MRQSNRKFKPNPSYNRSIRSSSSIRDILGDRRFKDVNTHGTEGIEKVKRMKVGDAEADDLPNLGRNASSIQCEGTEDPRRSCGDFAAKTSEFAFFRRMKKNTCSNIHVPPKHHDSQLNNVQQSDHFVREEIPNLQKENMRYARPSLPVEKEVDEVHYSFLTTPCCGSKKYEVNNAFGAWGTNVHNIQPDECNWLSPSVGSKTKTLGNKGLFSAKREKLHRWVADKTLYDVKDISTKGFDLVSVLINRLLPEDHENNCRRDAATAAWCQDETDSKYELSSFSESKAATLIKSHEDYKRRSIKPHHISYLDDGFPRSIEGLVDMDIWEWDPTISESSSIGHAPKSSIQFNHRHTEGGFRIPKFALESILSFEEAIPRYESGSFEEIEESDTHNGLKLLKQPHTLLLGWEHASNSNQEELQLSTWNSQMEINTSSTPQDKDYVPDISFMSSPPSSLCNDTEHFLGSPSLSYTPKHLAVIEDCSINDNFPPQYYNWCLNESLNEKEHRDSESFLYLIQSPANNLVRFLNTGLCSFAFNVESEENLLHSPDEFSEGGVKTYHSSSYMELLEDKHFDHIGYPLLLGNSSENE